MHLIDAKCNNTIITSLFHFASTFATQNVIKKNQNEINYYIITKRAATTVAVNVSYTAALQTVYQYQVLTKYSHQKNQLKRENNFNKTVQGF